MAKQSLFGGSEIGRHNCLTHMSATKSALLLGATGATGKHLLRELIKSPEFGRVGEYGRRVTPLDSLNAPADKLEQKVIDFEKLDEAGLKDGKWDVVFIT